MPESQDRGSAADRSAAPPGLRIGDAEREQAADLLGAHLRAGRLSVTEYDERLQQAFTARTEADVTPLFADLPGGSPLAAPPERPRDRQRRGYRTVPVPVRTLVVLALIVGAIAWTVFLAFPPLFLIPVLWFFHGRPCGTRRRYRPHRY